MRRISVSHKRQRSNSRCWRHSEVGAPRGVARIVGARQIQTRGRAKILAAVLAVAHARARPAVAEHAIHAVARNDFLGDFGHELEVVGAQRAGDPQSGMAQWRRFWPAASTAIQSGCCVADILVCGVRIGARHHHHAQFPAARRQFAERVAAAQPRAAIMQRDGRGIEGHASARAQTGGVGMRALEVIQPESGIVLAGVVFHQGQLGPAHGAMEPALGFGGGGVLREGSGRQRGGAQEIAAIQGLPH
jgi:hypothetical protein